MMLLFVKILTALIIMILLIVNVKLVYFMQIDFWYVRIIQQYLTESILTRDTFLKVCMILNVLNP